MRPNKLIKWASIRWSLVTGFLFGFVALGLYAFEYKLASSAILWTADKSILEQLTLLSERPPDILPFMIASRMTHQPSVITQVGLFDQSGNPLVGNIQAIPLHFQLNGQVQVRQIVEGNTVGNTQSIVARVAGRTLPSGRILLVARNMSDIKDIRSSFLNAFIIGLVPAILISVFAGLVVRRETRRRLDEMNRLAERIIAGQIHLRLPTSSLIDEIDELAITFNRILSETEELITTLKGVGEDIAHDLRTPLTWTRTRLERALELANEQDPLKSLIDQTLSGLDQTLGTISSLLRIAEIEQVRRQANFSVCDLSEIVRETVDTFDPIAEEKQIHIAWSGPPHRTILADRELIVEAIVNLVDNALKFSPNGSEVSLTVGEATSNLIFRIQDNGPGIASEERELVLRRFYRSDKSRHTKGSGLGLNLVAAVAKLHEFLLVISSNSPGCLIEFRNKTPASIAPPEAAE